MGTFRFPVSDLQCTQTPSRLLLGPLYPWQIRAGLDFVVYQSLNEPAAHLRGLLSRANAQSAELFAPDGLGHAPFADGQVAAFQALSLTSDYEYGSLNGHKTDIGHYDTRRFRSTAHERSALWVRGADDTWRNVDSALAANEVVLMLGEELESTL